jgi:hypothetical protein
MLQAALTGQYRAGLAMLRAAVEACPDDLWAEGEHPRTTWRIVYHALFYTHLYLMSDEVAFRPWEKHRPHARILWEDDEEGMPPRDDFYSQTDLLGYLDWIDERVATWVEALDLESPESGFPWYPIPKLDHQILNVRHLQGHVGQVSELLMARGFETPWVARR